jgi:hemoglobin/transferrin/lactoferrin receptor protein
MSAGIAFAQEPSPPSTLRDVNVTATRMERAEEDTAATVSTIDAQAIERGLVRDLQDLLRYEPGVTATGDPNRADITGINIRGLQDNRVQTLVDGVRISDFFSFGISGFNTATRNLVDVDSLKRVEIVRGPASTLYGSDALGGVVAFLTKDPADYLAGRDKPWYASLKGGYWSADRSWTGTATFAGTTGNIDGLVVYTYRNGHELETQGTNDGTGPSRTVANPQDYRGDNVLAKVLARTSARNQFRLIAESYALDTQTNVLSLNAATPRTSTLNGDDRNRRARVSLDQEYNFGRAGALEAFKWTLYWQRASADSQTDETRSRTTATCSGTVAGTNTCFIPRQFEFDQTTVGFSGQAQGRFATGSAAHQILYGVDVFQTNTFTLRDATRFNLTTGTSSKTIAGDTFPVRDFPDSRTLQAGIFVQDEITFLGGRATVVPGIRYDYYRLRVDPDAIYLANVPPGQVAQDFNDSAWSPKLGGIWRFDDKLQAYLNLASGFRAPPYAELNAAFRNPVQSYVLIPNLDLQSETSRGIELGLRGNYKQGTFSVVGFYNRYKDFIDAAVQLDCPADPRCVRGFLFTFQAVNRGRVEIGGIEARGTFPLPNGFTAIGSIGYARGTDLDADQPINTIQPLKGVAGLNYAAPDDRYGGAVNLTMVAAQNRVDETAGPLFKSPGFAIVDLTAYWNVTRSITVNAGLFNVFDRTYWLWSTLFPPGFPPTDPGLGRYTQPGRNAAVTLKVVF